MAVIGLPEGVAALCQASAPGTACCAPTKKQQLRGEWDARCQASAPGTACRAPTKKLQLRGDSALVLSLRQMLVRQLENPDGRAVVGRILNLGDEYREGCGLRAAISDDDGDVLLAVDAVGDGT